MAKSKDADLDHLRMLIQKHAEKARLAEEQVNEMMIHASEGRKKDARGIASLKNSTKFLDTFYREMMKTLDELNRERDYG